MSEIRAVTFDAGGTLIEPWPSVGAVYAEVASEFGLECSPVRINDQFAAAWRSRTSFGYTRNEWFEIVQQSFLGACDISATLFEAIYNRFAQRSSWLIYEDAIPVLQQIEARGIKLAVISNWDERLVPLLEILGLANYFSEIVVSSAVGAHKPDPRIFRYAIERLGIEPHAVLHVGDGEREDIEGARAAGMRAFRIRRTGASEPHDIERLTDLIDRVRSVSNVTLTKH
jgi:putative hydrolase of the HAD superfamily